MDDQRLFDELLRAARGLGLAVRVERFETPAAAGGAACVLHGERLILIDAGAPLWDRVGALARALAGQRTDAVFMLPEARELVDAVNAPCAPGAEAAQ